MSKIYRVKYVPPTIKAWFRNAYPESCTFQFYWYEGSRKQRVYGCRVMKNGELFSYSVQGTLGWFQKARRDQLKLNAA